MLTDKVMSDKEILQQQAQAQRPTQTYLLFP